jgi:ribonuclease HI
MSKRNVDAAVSKNSGHGALAAIARLTEGVFLGASVVAVQGISDPEVLEALACREGLALTSDLLLTNFRVASDCLNVIKSLESAGWGCYGHIVQEIKARAGDFINAQFVHEGRVSNGDAHRLARGSISRDIGRHVWFLAPPEGVCNIYMLNK